MKRFHPSPALVISLIALFVALGGTSYAAITSLPANSVGTKQLKNSAVTGTKLNAAVLKYFLHVGSTLPSGRTESGVYAAWARASAGAGFMSDSVNFPVPLGADLPAGNVVFVFAPATSDTHCSGLGHADAGYLCVYETHASNRGLDSELNPVSGDGGASKYGFSVEFIWPSDGEAWSYGSWTVTAP